MRTFLAWRNLVQHPARSLSAGAGVSFAILLMFMQLGFHSGCSENARLIYRQLDFDLVMVSSQYVYFRQCNWFARARLEQARGEPEVQSISSVHIGTLLYRNPVSRLRYEMMVLGVDPADRPFRTAELDDKLPRIAEEDTVLIDQESRPEVGPQNPGTATELNGRRIRLVGQYAMGTGFISTGSLLVGERTFLKTVEDAARDRINLGLVRLRPGASPAEAARRLQAAVGPEVRVMTRDEVEAMDENFLVNVKPVGIMFTSGVCIAFIVGGVTLYQVLVADASARLAEYATLKAMGYTDGFVYGVLLQQGLLYVALGFVPAFCLSFLLYWPVRILARLPAYMTLERVLCVALMTAVMCAASTAVALRKLRAADTADLF